MKEILRQKLITVDNASFNNAKVCKKKDLFPILKNKNKKKTGDIYKIDEFYCP